VEDSCIGGGEGVVLRVVVEGDQNDGQPHTLSWEGVRLHEDCGWVVVGDMVIIAMEGERRGGVGGQGSVDVGFDTIAVRRRVCTVSEVK
jgi:hypothetical protein